MGIGHPSTSLTLTPLVVTLQICTLVRQGGASRSQNRMAGKCGNFATPEGPCDRILAASWTRRASRCTYVALVTGGLATDVLEACYVTDASYAVTRSDRAASGQPIQLPIGTSGSAPAQSSGPTSDGKKIMVVYYIGGVTFMEVAALRFLSSQSDCK